MNRRLEDVAHIEVVRFDRVFDVQAGRGNFSFDSGGKRQFGVQFAGGDIPAEGARYAVALAEPGNWQRIIGWRDLAGAQVRLKESAWDVAWGEAYIWYMLVPVFIIAALLLIGPWAALAAFCLAVWLSVHSIRYAVQRNRLVDAALRAVDPPAPPGAGGVPKSTRERLVGIITGIFGTSVSG